MKSNRTKVAATIAIILIISSTVSVCLAEAYTTTYQLLDKIDGTAAYKLNVAVPQSLYEYYSAKSHRLTSDRDYAKFVTPYALKPIADNLRSLYSDDEDFVNGALMIVHQIPYEETTPPKYPAETIVDNQGDCDLFACIAASIMKAGGLDVALLFYEEEEHMNVGVHLSEAPKDARENVYSVTFENVTYYMAECTGGNWTYGWRVGECPTSLKNATAQIVTLENSEALSPGQVSASLTALESSEISLEISPTITFQDSTIVFRGQLTPNEPDENVTIYVGASGSPWAVAGTAVTQSDGRFEYVWKAEAAGIYAVRASWPGDDAYMGAVSQTQNAFVVPFFLVALIALVVAVIIVSAVAVFVLRHAKKKPPQPEELQPPSFQ